jgi:hypothetical protein
MRLRLDRLQLFLQLGVLLRQIPELVAGRHQMRFQFFLV